MVEATQFSLKEFVSSNSSFGPSDVKTIARAICNDYAQFPVLRDLTAEMEVHTSRTPASSVRLGICQFLLGRYRAAAETLANADGGALAFYYQGKAHVSLGAHDRAIECFDSARKSGYNGDECSVAVAEAMRMKGDLQGSMTVVDNLFGPIEQTAEYLYQRAATIAAMGTNPEEVVALYTRAVELDDKHAGALFGLGLENDRRGNDDKAMELYQRATGVFPSSVGALLNLGLLYEDHGQYQRAVRCYDRVLESFPNHERAKLYRKDSVESLDGGERWDEDAERVQRRMQTIMNVPIAQFELSVRSRNCLQKMGIMTIGDLTRITEAELLASKNFGETSLTEIRDVLANRGLQIGQFAAAGAVEPDPIDNSNLSPDEQALFDRPISDLNLSVRARKCMTRLGLTTIGELVRKSQDDLLECKNFGVTSLTEVREKLTQAGLKLRGE